MSKLIEKEKTIRLRLKGKSISEIADTLQIRWATISKWCKQIQLTPEQQKFIDLRVKINGQKKLRRYYELKRNKKAETIKKIQKSTTSQIRTLSKNELFLMGTMLYWAEGFKSKAEHRLGFCNSDPKMILFYIKWLKKCLFVNQKDLTLRLTINHSYKDSASEIEKYWSKLLKLPLSQFTKPFFQKTKWLKNYLNKKQYHGVMRVHVRKSVKLLWKVLAVIDQIKIITVE